MADIALTINWDQDTLRNQANMNSNDNALIAGLSDGTKDITVNQITPVLDLDGKASTMEKLSTPSTITLTGDCTSSVSFDGTAEANLNVTNTKGVIASCGLTFGITKSVEEVLQNHSTDVDLDGNNTMTTWGKLIRSHLASQFEYVSQMFGNSTIWGYFSTTPLSSEESTIMSNNIHYEITNSSNISSVDATVSNALLARDLQGAIIINLDPSLGTDPHAYTVLSNYTLPDMNDTFFWDVAMLGLDPNMVGSPQYRMVLQRNDELNPTHLQVYFHKSQESVNYLTGSDPGSWPEERNFNPMGVAQQRSQAMVRIAALKLANPARATEYDALVAKAKTLIEEYNELLIGYQVTYGETLFPDTLILPNTCGYTSPVSVTAGGFGYRLAGVPNYLRNNDQIVMANALQTYFINHSIVDPTDSDYITNVKDIWDDIEDEFNTSGATGNDNYSSSIEDGLGFYTYFAYVFGTAAFGPFLVSQLFWDKYNPFYLPYKFNLILCRQ